MPGREFRFLCCRESGQGTFSLVPSLADLTSCGSLICGEKKPIYNFSTPVLNVVANIQECVCLELIALGDSLRKQGLLVSCSDSGDML